MPQETRKTDSYYEEPTFIRDVNTKDSSLDTPKKDKSKKQKKRKNREKQSKGDRTLLHDISTYIKENKSKFTLYIFLFISVVGQYVEGFTYICELSAPYSSTAGAIAGAMRSPDPNAAYVIIIYIYLNYLIY